MVLKASVSCQTLIIRAGQFDRQVHFIEKGMTRSVHLARWKRNNDMVLYGR